MDEASIREQSGKLMQQPAFQRLSALPDPELRALAAGEGGRALASRFTRELVRDQDAKIAQEALKDPDAAEATQRKPVPNDPQIHV